MQQQYAIRFGLGAIKAVGLGMMETAVAERKNDGQFKDIYDFCKRLDAKSINKKSIEALAKSGAFDCFGNQRRQFFESFDVLSSYAAEKKDEAQSNQMSLFGALLGEENSKPKLKEVAQWSKQERLQKEFEAFGFFLNEHPLDDYLPDLRKRGVVFSDKIEKDEFEDNCLVKMAGIVAGSKHRSSARGRFAYLTISDPLGIFEAMIFDEEIITNARDILVDGSAIMLECLVRKDDGGVRILVRAVQKLEEFIRQTKAAEAPFEDIKKQQARRKYNNEKYDADAAKPAPKGAGQNFAAKNAGANGGAKNNSAKDEEALKQIMERLEAKQVFSEVQIVLSSREAVLAVKSTLAMLYAPQNISKKTKVFLVVKGDEGNFKIELAAAYFLDKADTARLGGISGVVDVVAV